MRIKLLSLNRFSATLFSSLCLLLLLVNSSHAGGIAGTVTSTNGTTPLGDIGVEVYRFNSDERYWEGVAYRYTDVSGNYNIGGLTAGSYRVEFSDWAGSYVGEVYNNVRDLDSGTDVVVSALTTVSGINASLSAASHIVGIVTGSDGITPLEGISVSAYQWNEGHLDSYDGTLNWEIMGSTDTDASGNYNINGLIGGAYRVKFSDWNGSYVSEVYIDAPNLDAGRKVEVGYQATKTGVDASLIGANASDGDIYSDIAVFDKSAGNWYVQYSALNNDPQAKQFGWSETVPVPADYDGDGLIDIAVYYPAGGMWYIQDSTTGRMRQVQWGWSQAAPVPGDYDGDGRSDIAVFHQATGNWYIQYSTLGNDPAAEQFGWSEVVPIPADYDGDGKTDVAVYYPNGGMWYIHESSTGLRRDVQWGWSAAVPVPGDYDGDGDADIAVFHRATGNWYIQYSTLDNAPAAEQFGWSAVVPVPADYDGDGKTDVAVYHAPTGTWYIRESTTGEMRQVQWGWSEAIPTLLITTIHDWFGMP